MRNLLVTLAVVVLSVDTFLCLPSVGCLLVQVCPLTVPKYHMFKKTTADQHYELMGYEKAADPKTGKERFELPDRYLQRVGGYIAFYAAVMQSEQWPLRHPNGISAAWQFLARWLLYTPPPG